MSRTTAVLCFIITSSAAVICGSEALYPSQQAAGGATPAQHRMASYESPGGSRIISVNAGGAAACHAACAVSCAMSISATSACATTQAARGARQAATLVVTECCAIHPPSSVVGADRRGFMPCHRTRPPQCCSIPLHQPHGVTAVACPSAASRTPPAQRRDGAAAPRLRSAPLAQHRRRLASACHARACRRRARWRWRRRGGQQGGGGSAFTSGGGPCSGQGLQQPRARQWQPQRVPRRSKALCAVHGHQRVRAAAHEAGGRHGAGCCGGALSGCLQRGCSWHLAGHALVASVHAGAGGATVQAHCPQAGAAYPGASLRAAGGVVWGWHPGRRWKGFACSAAS